jgi:hypothetical protein
VTARRARAVSRFESRLARALSPTLEGAATQRSRSEPSPVRDRHEGRALGAGRDLVPLPADIAADLVAGRLSQRCEPCGITEAAGGYCSRCGRQTGPADWFRQAASEAQQTARQAKGRDRAENGATAAKSPPPEPLDLWPA